MFTKWQSRGRNIAKVAEGLPWSPKGGTVVATVIAQWTLLVGQRRHNGGTRKAEALLKLMHNVHNRTHFFTGRPMADHCASILPPWRCVCLPPASFERPVSDRPPRRPLCDCFEHAQNFTATMASMAMSERPVYHPWATKATVLPPLCLQRRPGQFCGRTMEAERSQPLCKGGITTYITYHLSPLYTPLHRGCDLCASLVRPQNQSGRCWRQKGGRKVVQGWHGGRSDLAMDAMVFWACSKQSHKGRQGGRSLTGRSKEAGGRYRHRRGRRMDAQGSVIGRLIKNAHCYKHCVSISAMFLPPSYHHGASFCRPIASIEWSLWRPLWLHSVTMATLEPPWRWFCLHSASFARPVKPLQEFLVAQGTHEGRAVAVTQKQNFLGLSDHWAFWSNFWSPKGGTKVAALCKGGL